MKLDCQTGNGQTKQISRRIAGQIAGQIAGRIDGQIAGWIARRIICKRKKMWIKKKLHLIKHVFHFALSKEKIRIGNVLKSTDIGTLFSRRNSENHPTHMCIPMHIHTYPCISTHTSAHPCTPAHTRPHLCTPAHTHKLPTLQAAINIKLKLGLHEKSM